MIVEVHGGPQSNYGYAMFHEIQWFAAQGYAIVFVNPRGSMSYGQEFVNVVRHHYGENDAADVLHGLDAALDQFDLLDGNRVALSITTWRNCGTSRRSNTHLASRRRYC